jgi:hypothetical protein
MVYLPFDVAHLIVEALAPSNEGDSMKALSSAGFVSKTFAHVTRKRVFHHITVDTYERCSGLLALVNSNATLQAHIEHLTIALPPGSKNHLHSPVSVAMITSPDCAELMPKLVTLTKVTFRNITFNHDLTTHLLNKTLAQQYQSITQLSLTSCESLTLGDVDDIIQHLPALETLWQDGTGWCTWVVADKASPVYLQPLQTLEPSQSHRYAASHMMRRLTPLRRVRLQLQGTIFCGKLPSWFTARAYLSSIQELEIVCHETLPTHFPWDLVAITSSTLTHLCVTAPHGFDSRDKKKLVPRLQSIDAPSLATLCLTNMVGRSGMDWLCTTLSTISFSLSIHVLHLNILRVDSSEPPQPLQPWTVLDGILDRRFLHLKRVCLKLAWNHEYRDHPPTEEDVRREMPKTTRRDVLELEFSVKCESCWGLDDLGMWV